MSVFDKIFGPKPAEVTPAVAPNAAAQPPSTTLPGQPTVTPVQGVNTAPNGTTPTDPNAPPSQTPSAENADQSPLAEYKELWQTAPIDPNAPEPVDPLAIDANTLQEHVAKINFAESITPEVLAKVAAGGEDATGAFVEALNAVARNVLTQSTLVGNKLAQRASDHSTQTVQDSVANLIKQTQLTQNLSQANPVFDHPAVKPVIDSVKDQLMVKHPQATPAELTTMAQNFALAMAGAINPQAPALQDQQTADSSDFSTFEVG